MPEILFSSGQPLSRLTTISPENVEGEFLRDGEKSLEGSCVNLVVTCGDSSGDVGGEWPLAHSLSCLVGAGCVVLPDEEYDYDEQKKPLLPPVVAK
mmetsp:Transcript_13620/g.45397  ORF Transcript_13620/g.45397 Transcript_13620/m.45397 type:complete len:96 (-) Transcript_13620:79-366(-)